MPDRQLSDQPHILVIDDDPEFHSIIRWMLEQNGFSSTCLKKLDSSSSHLIPTKPVAVLLDWQLDDKNGFDLLPILRNLFPAAPVIMLTSHSTTDLAVQAMRLGAFDFIPKPVDEGRLFASITKAIEHGRLVRLLESSGQLPNEELGFEGILGRTPQIRTVFRIIQQIAPTHVNVMITGESGTGKELVARAVHQRSSRSTGPLVALNMAAIPKELAESTLFGHEKGAFTGADRQRLGACGEAQGGTLFLDELCEMPLELQAKLLRFLQERVYRRVGGDKDLTADVRIICATNRDPAAEVRDGRLRVDLFYRLNVVPIELPPLRERLDDVPLLASAAMKLFSLRYLKRFVSIEPSAINWLSRQTWPGNVRQLYHTIERAVVLHDGEILKLNMLPPGSSPSSPAPGSPVGPGSSAGLGSSAGVMPGSPLIPANGPVRSAANASGRSELENSAIFDIASYSNAASGPRASNTPAFPGSGGVATRGPGSGNGGLVTPSRAGVNLNEGSMSGMADALPPELPFKKPVNGASSSPGVSPSVLDSAPDSPVIPMAELERRAIAHALGVFNGSPAKAAEALGISEATIYRRIKTYNIAVT